MDVYSFLATSPAPTVAAQEPTISEILNEKAAAASGGHLNHDVAANVVCLLSQKVDRCVLVLFVLHIRSIHVICSMDRGLT